ncbi:hypothetical protein L7F22_017499 [Adiantum nelumboides]|nr:hypothetical protein [Adiantum nelumboides]
MRRFLEGHEKKLPNDPIILQRKRHLLNGFDESQLTRKEAQNHELIKNEKKMKKQLKYDDARFQKISASYNTVKNTLTALLQNQEPASAVASTSDSATANTLAALQEELQTEKLQRQLLVSGFMIQTAQHEAKVKQLELELAQAKDDLELQKQQSEVLSKDRIYDSSIEDVESNPTTETKIDKEAEAMAKRKIGLPNWLLPDDQEIEEWNLDSEQDPNMIKINQHLKKELKDKSWNLFLKFKVVFVWEHTDLKGVDLEVCQHRIPLKPDAGPLRLQRDQESSLQPMQSCESNSTSITRNLDNKGTTLNKVRVLPSASSGSKTKPVVQVNVVTRAQAKDLEKEKPMEENAGIPVPTENGSLSVRTQHKSWKAKRDRMKARKAKSQTAIQEELQEVKQQLQQERESKMIERNNQPRKASSGGSVLVDKVLEPLDALLQAWEARLNNNQTLEQRWLTYPYPEIEIKRLEMYKELIKAAQALMEPNVVRALENEVLIHKDLEKQGDKEPKPVMGPKADTNMSLEHRMVPNTTDEVMTIEVMPVPEVEEPWPQSLWEIIRNKKDGSAALQSAPIPKIVLNNEFYPGDIQSLYGDNET